MGTSQICGHDAASHFTEELITLTDTKPTDRVMIVGYEHIEVLIALARRGFVEAICRSAVSGPNAGEAAADLIVAPAVQSEAELLAILRLGRCLRPGAALLFGLADRPREIWQGRLPSFLLRHGFVLVREHQGSAGRPILCCRKLPTWQAQAARSPARRPVRQRLSRLSVSAQPRPIRVTQSSAISGSSMLPCRGHS